MPTFESFTSTAPVYNAASFPWFISPTPAASAVDVTANATSFLATVTANQGAAYFPPGLGCYWVSGSGILLQNNLVALLGSQALFRSDGPTVTSLYGTVFAPINSSVTSVFRIGVTGNGSVVTTNPHGITIEGIGIAGITPSGVTVSGMYGFLGNDTSDVTFRFCSSLYCDTVLSGGPTGGTGTGGWVNNLSSSSGNGFGENWEFIACRGFGDGKAINVDGSGSGFGGSTDGKIIGCQWNSHNRGIQLGPSNAGTGGWSITDCHFSSASGLNHINYGSAGSPYTLRVTGCYFDVVASTGNAIVCNGRGLECINNYFRAGASSVQAIAFGAGLDVTDRDPHAVVMGNIWDMNTNTNNTVVSFGIFKGFTAANVAANAAGIYSRNFATNHGASLPTSWVAQWVGSDNAAVAATSNGNLILDQGCNATA
jgi:hypothetical protein